PIVDEIVTIREVGPRDGLQSEPPLPPRTRAKLVEGLVDAGIRVVEAVAFVSPVKVPSMDQPLEVMRQVQRNPDAEYIGLVPNLRGAEIALGAAMDGVSVTLSASDEYSKKNVGRSRRESEEETRRIIEFLGEVCPDLKVDVVVSCAFGSPYGERIEKRDIRELTSSMKELGATVTLADTTGVAMPAQIEEMFADVGTDVGAHFHDSQRTALVNAYVALMAGCRRFDASIGGLGGSPFAQGSAGNLATEELVRMLDHLDVQSGIDLDALLRLSLWLSSELGHPMASPLAATAAQLR
ncbi:MAG TPA: hypothetical protein VEJ87_06720, partial [Acidimicrobiales bacterium]|nr:hypothetical protein [Acidimicrobiales bacterium]